jgi:hypothetical protein
VIELPGIGGSARIDPRSAAQIAAVMEEAAALLGIEATTLLEAFLSAD